MIGWLPEYNLKVKHASKRKYSPHVLVKGTNIDIRTQDNRKKKVKLSRRSKVDDDGHCFRKFT